MAQYKLKYKYWYVNADNAEQAKRKAVSEIRKYAESLIDVEPAKTKQKDPSLLRLLFLGK